MSEINQEQNKKKSKDNLDGIILDTPQRVLPDLINEILDKKFSVRLTNKGYLISGFYGLGDDENKGFASVQETNTGSLIFFDNKGHKHLITNFEDVVKFHNYIWGVFFKISDEYKKPDINWFPYMLQYGVLNITPGTVK